MNIPYGATAGDAPIQQRLRLECAPVVDTSSATTRPTDTGAAGRVARIAWPRFERDERDPCAGQGRLGDLILQCEDV